MNGTVHRIRLAPEQGADPEPVDSVEAVAGRGLRGDRYFRAVFASRGDLRCQVVDGGRIGHGDRIQRSSTGTAGSEE